jgi:hypothetical protein
MIGSLRRTLYAAGALLLALLYAFARGRRSARRETALEAAERYAKTRKDMDDAEASMGDDPVVLRDWLKERGSR